MILQSPFTSIKAVLKSIDIFESPVANFFAQVGSTFVADRFMNKQCLRKVPFPLLVLHGADDDLIPMSHGKAIYEASQANLKKIIVFPDVGHNNFDWILVIKKMKAFLDRLARYYCYGRKLVVNVDTPAVRAKRKGPSGNVEQRAKNRAKSSSNVTNVVSSTVGTIFGGAIGMVQSLIPESKESKLSASPNTPETKVNVELPMNKRSNFWQCSSCTYKNKPSANVCVMCYNHMSNQEVTSSVKNSLSPVRKNELPI